MALMTTERAKWMADYELREEKLMAEDPMTTWMAALCEAMFTRVDQIANQAPCIPVHPDSPIGVHLRTGRWPK